MSDPFTIRVFVADGDPEGLRIVDRLNWTGVGLVFPREQWPNVKDRPEFSRTGIYILVGYKEGEEELPTVYIGEADAVRTRIDSHMQTKDFWEHAYVFVTSNNGLNKAHVRWLERELIGQAKTANRSKPDNATAPNEPPLSEAEKADSRAFLREILQALPIMGLRAFEPPKPVAVPLAAPIPPNVPPGMPQEASDSNEVIVVPAQDEGFKSVFLAQNRWHAIRIAGGKIPEIRYIAAYQSKPVSAITHYAPVASIEPYGENGKYQLIFASPAIEIGPIPFGNAPTGYMQGTRYTTLQKLMTAKTVTDLF
jgi:hypothetical protein